ncbi:MAG: NDP-hexose 3-C-methyltransferase TylCIII [Myxococcaceae bacterium]|nr:NDP-hexose 3-C-methyltransferase TylCIII [Myxococcaceae bacterium]
MTSITPLTSCRICGNTQLELVLDLGEQALTGIFPRSPEATVTTGPLRLLRCHGGREHCGLLQLAHTFDSGEMYGDQYGYRSGLNASMALHLAEKVSWLQSRRPLSAGDVVLDIGSNDGTTLGNYPAHVTRIGIDPTTEKFRQFHPPGIQAVAEFFSAAAFRQIAGTKKASIVTSLSMFYDLPAPMEFVRDVAEILADDGVWHFEQSYLPLMLKTNSYDTVCHEHLEYYALAQIEWMVTRCGLRITDVQFNDVNGGSFAVTVEKGVGHAAKVNELLAEEAWIASPETWANFRAMVERHRSELRGLLTQLKDQGKRVYGLGASTKGNVVLQYCGITTELLEKIAEVNPDKFGSFTPGTGIPICSEAEALSERPDIFMVLPWHFRKGILKNHQPFIDAGGALLFPLPTIEFVPAL